MRTVSLTMRQALFAQESGEVAVFLVRISHQELADDILLSSDPTARLSIDPLRYGTISNGETFYFVGMAVSLPDEQDKSPPAAKLIIPNVDRAIIPLARSVTSAPEARIQVVLASDPDTVEIEVPALDMVSLDYDVLSLTFQLTMESLAQEPFPSGSFDPASFPGLYY